MNRTRPAIISISDVRNPNVNLKKGVFWHQSGNNIKLATTSNPILPIEIVKSNNPFEYLNIVLFIPQLPDFITINNQLD